jgi:predicted MFS family arabinose efflux permease
MRFREDAAMAVREEAEATQAEALNWGAKAIMMLGGVTVTLGMVVVTPVLPQIEAALAHDAGDRLLVKLLVTVMGFSMVVGAPLAGLLTDRLGMRKVLLAACGLYVLAGTAGLYLQTLPALIASRLLVGVAAAAIGTISMTLINTSLNAEGRARWMGIHVAAATLAGIVITPLVGALGELGWHWPFAAFLLLGAPLTIVALGVPRRRPEGKPRAAPKRGRPTLQSLLSGFPLPWVALALAMGSISFLPAVYLPFVVRQVGVTSPSVISLVLLANTIVGSTLALLFVRARRHISSTTAFVWSFTCAAVGLTTVGVAGSLAAIVAGMMIFGLSLGWFVPNLMTAAARSTPADSQGRTVGWIKAGHYLAAPAATVIVEPLTRVHGPGSAMLAIGGLSAALAVLFAVQLVTPARAAAAAAREEGR